MALKSPNRLWSWLRISVALALLGVVLSVVYRYAPSAKQSLRSVAPGAAVAVVAWAITSVGFSVYLRPSPTTASPTGASGWPRVFSPGLDAYGNSVRGIKVCEEISERLGLHVFADAAEDALLGPLDSRKRT